MKIPFLLGAVLALLPWSCGADGGVPPARTGGCDFRMAALGPWTHIDAEGARALRQMGLHDRILPGSLRLAAFAADSKESPVFRNLAREYLRNGWPFPSVEYVIFQGRPLQQPETPDVARLYLGDGQPEQTYRLEPVFHFIRTEKKWNGSSMHLWKDECAVAFFRDRLVPRLRTELPFYADAGHAWTHGELRRLCDLYVDTFWEGRTPIAWGMYLSPWHLAARPGVTTIGEKGTTPFHMARGRGLMRQGGGDKVLFTWQGHEPTERYYSTKSAWYSTRGDNWGMPWLRYYIFRSYLCGANYATIESLPGGCYDDVEGDGQYEPTPMGLEVRSLLDFAARHPDRGVPFAPIALLLDEDREIGVTGATYMGYNLPYDDADQMNHGIVRDLLFPEHRHQRFAGDYFSAAPYGEIFDLLKPNLPMAPGGDRGALLAGYQVLFALGGLKIDTALAADFEARVRAGATLVVNAEDAGSLPETFLGASVSTATQTGNSIVRAGDGRVFAEKSFAYRTLVLKDARATYTCDGRPIVTVAERGKGRVMIVAPRFMIQNDAEETVTGRNRTKWRQKPVLRFAADLVEQLARDASPIEVRCAEQDRRDLGWTLSRKGDGWVVALFNYSLETELDVRTEGTAKVVARYPYKRLPVEIVCRTPVQDIMDWYEDRDVTWARHGETASITESIRGGEVRVYELQPHRIDPGRFERSVNHALRKPVTASTQRPGYEAGRAVDGDLDNDAFWWSWFPEPPASLMSAAFPMPQWIQVDLQQTQSLDHVAVQFHTWPDQTLDTRLRICKYHVDVSVDGENWTTVLDERRSEKPVTTAGLERWFDPTAARYVRLTVLRNSAHSGAQVVELRAMGPARETVPIERKPAPPAN